MQPELIAGRYLVQRAIGRGGMGTVWLCRDEVLHREVAVKQIEGLQGEPAAEAARPLREARLAAALNHENAVSLFDIVDHEGSTWLVMEYVPSQTLAEILEQGGRLPVDRVAKIGAQLASALATSHALGIIHRDIKPDNVLIGEGDLAKISDFGIARGHQDEQLTLTGFVTGTPSYFSPELARGGDASPASDVWGLGATLYAAVEGAPPYGTDPNPLALLGRIASQPPPRPLHAGPLTDILASMLNPNAAARASMETIVVGLLQLAEPANADTVPILEQDNPDERPTVLTPRRELSSTAVIPPVVIPEAEPTTATGGAHLSPNMLIAGLVALLVLVVAGGLMWSIFRSDPGGNPSTADGHHQNSPRTGGSSSPTGSTGSTGSTTSRQTTPQTSQPHPPPVSGQGPAAFVSSYFGLVPDDLKSGWKALSPSMRKVGRDSYESFWGSIDSVDLADVHAVAADVVDCQVTYHFSDGRVVREQHRLDVAPHAHSYWITDETVLSSTTLHS